MAIQCGVCVWGGVCVNVGVYVVCRGNMRHACVVCVYGLYVFVRVSYMVYMCGMCMWVCIHIVREEREIHPNQRTCH